MKWYEIMLIVYLLPFVVFFPVSEMTWQPKYSIEADGRVFACNMISDNQLAVCMRRHVDIYELGISGASHLYRVAAEEWEGGLIFDVAVSDSSPGSMLIICGMPYVYQCTCEEPSTIINKYKINVSDETVDAPQCIAANLDTAVLGMDNSLIVCKLPGFTQQSHVTLDMMNPYDLTLTTNHVVVMDDYDIVVKPLDDIRQDVCRITSPPDGYTFQSVCHRHNGKELYVGCMQKRGVKTKGCVYNYTWDGSNKPQYVNPTCIIDGIDRRTWSRYLSVTSGGLLAVGIFKSEKVLIYKLQ